MISRLKGLATDRTFLKDTALFVIIVALASFLRFSNLGYSDYIGDEHKAFIQPRPYQTTWTFFMQQRKGPMQFFISYIPYLFTHDYRNEFAERLPFALISTLSCGLFYLIALKLTKSRLASFIAAFLYAVNGFIVGFGRIVQYQNLNLIFSLLTLYFYLSLLENPGRKKALISSVAGTVFFSLSLLSHWDAIFILPVIFICLLTYLKEKANTAQDKRNMVLVNIVVGMVVLLPFLIPYLGSYVDNSANQAYLSKRMEFGLVKPLLLKLTYELYNPFLSLAFLAITALVGALFVKRTWIVTIWFLLVFTFFELFFRKPGTHIYNFILPLFILSGYGAQRIISAFPRVTKSIPAVAVALFLASFYYQSYVIFVDHSKEYPFEQKTIGKWTTPVYEGYLLDQRLPLFGFPHYRYWDEINNFINHENIVNNENYGYRTNEDKTVSDWYMFTENSSQPNIYFVSVRRPMYWIENWKAVGVSNKVLVKVYEKDGEEIVRIYKKLR